MALYVIIAVLASLALASDLGIDIEHALLVEEECANPTLSLLQRDAVPLQKRPGPQEHEVIKAAVVKGEIATVHKDVLAVPSLHAGLSSTAPSGKVSSHKDVIAVAVHGAKTTSSPQASIVASEKKTVGRPDVVGDKQVQHGGKAGVARNLAAELPDHGLVSKQSASMHHKLGQKGGVLPVTFVLRPYTSWQVVAVVLCLVAFSVVMALVWAVCTRLKPRQSREEYMAKCLKASPKAERTQMEALPRSSEGDVLERLPAESGYDCALSRPLSSGQPVRLEAYVQGAADGSSLFSPLKQHLCVRYSAAVYTQERDGMRSHPVASHSASVHFVVSLVDAPHMRIEITDDVALFDMHAGHCSCKQALSCAPEHWKEFASSWPVGEHSVRRLQQSEEVLEFRESALLVGSRVSLLGELHRNAIGRLQLQPWRPPGEAKKQEAPCEPWRTSWEQSGCNEKAASSRTSASFGKVLVSDDPALLSTPRQRVVQAWTQSASAIGYLVKKALPNCVGSQAVPDSV